MRLFFYLWKHNNKYVLTAERGNAQARIKNESFKTIHL